MKERVLNGYCQVKSCAEANKYLYNGKELTSGYNFDETGGNDIELGWYSYGARYLDPALGRWTTPDPMAEVYSEWSIYNYVRNNPVLRIDPNGMWDDDYFNEMGQYLGKDDAITDNVRVIKQEDWDANKEVNSGNTETINHVIGNNLSSNASESNLNTESRLNIYEHYNPTDLPLSAKKSDYGGMAFHASKWSDNTTTEEIFVYVEGDISAKVSDHANEIISNFSHENKHYNDYKAWGFDEYRNTSLNIREERAIYTQTQNSSWNSTRESYKRAVYVYGERFGVLFPLTPLPANVNE